MKDRCLENNRREYLFVPVVLGRSDLKGLVQVKDGLMGRPIALYSEKTLSPRTRIRIVDKSRRPGND
jgi:hypothetical protein